MTSLTRWVLRHKLVVAATWIVIALVALASSGSATSALSQRFNLPPGYEGVDTNLAILHIYGTDGAEAPFIPVFVLPQGVTVATPGIIAQLGRIFSAIHAALPDSRVVSYASSGNRTFVSTDGQTTFGLVYPANMPGAQAPPPAATIEQVLARHPIVGARVYLTGRAALASWSNGGGGPGLLVETLVGGLGALLVLLFVFGSFLAVVPLLMALVSIPTTFLVVWGLTRITDVSFIVQFLIGLIGLGVSIDYSLLIVTRWREERASGYGNDEAVRRAMTTAGRAVVFSGTTVGISLLALVVLPIPFLSSVGYGGLLIPLVTVVVVSTLLPVLLATVGPRLDWPRRRHIDRSSWAWTAWARGVVQRRWIVAGAALLVLGALLIPLHTLVLGTPSVDALTTTGQAYQGLRQLEASGIGAGVFDPIVVLSTPRAATTLARQLDAVEGVRGAIAPTTTGWQSAGTALITVLPIADMTSADGHGTLDRVRQVAHSGLVPARVGGQAASDADFISAIYGSFPLMLGLIVVITFLLLVRAFRSVLLPLKAIVLNVISVGAAWGIMVLVWQQGYGSQPIWGIAATGAIDSWLPLMIFAFLFGLSMDYEVFILARTREEYDRTGSTTAAIVGGIGHTGRLVTSAALILVLAFIAMAAAPMTEVKMMATGLAAGIFLDATVVRMLLVPALVSLFGRWNWWLPELPARWLRIPQTTPNTQATQTSQ